DVEGALVAHRVSRVAARAAAGGRIAAARGGSGAVSRIRGIVAENGAALLSHPGFQLERLDLERVGIQPQLLHRRLRSWGWETERGNDPVGCGSHKKGLQ